MMASYRFASRHYITQEFGRYVIEEWRIFAVFLPTAGM